MAQLAPCHLIPLVFQAPQTLLHVRWSTPSANRQPLSPLFKMWSGAVRRDPDNTSVLPMDASDDDIQTPTQTPTSSAVVSLSSSEEVENIPRTSGLKHSAAAPFATKKDSVHVFAILTRIRNGQLAIGFATNPTLHFYSPYPGRNGTFPDIHF